MSPLRFEIKPGVLAIHDKALVVIEQIEGSHVNVRDLVTGAMLTVGELRGRYALRLTALLDQRVESVRTSDDSRVDLEQDREKALVSLFSARGSWQERMTNAAKELQISPRTIYREAGYRCQARTAASRWASTMGRFRQILLRGGGEQA